jgi:hypothetical protein
MGNQIGICGYCSFVQGYSPRNMLLISDHEQLRHDFCKSCKEVHPGYEDTENCEKFVPKNPDVYEGQTWFCQGCGSGTEFTGDEDLLDENGREVRGFEE